MSPAWTEAARAVLGAGEAAVATGLAVFLRVGAALAVAPALGDLRIPMRVRLALALAFTLVVAPAVPGAGAAAAPALLLVTEPVAGLALGLAVRLLAIALQMAGAMAAQATSLAQALGTAAPEPQPALAHLLLAAGLALAVMAGLHVRLAELLILSYDLFPPGRLPVPAALADWGQDRVARAFALAFALAAPFAAAALVYNLALGFINRAMPQLMVALVGAPALTLGGLALLALAAGPGLEVWRAALAATLANPFASPR